MITIQTKSKFQVKIDYFDVYSHNFQLHNYKIASATILIGKQLSTHFIRQSMENYSKLQRYSLTNHKPKERRTCYSNFLDSFS